VPENEDKIMRTSRKRAVSFGVVAGIGLGLVAGCGSSGEDTSSGTGALSGNPTKGSTLSDIFQVLVPGFPLCFQKTYDAAHLKSHPHQTVGTIRLELSKQFAAAPVNLAKITVMLAGEPRTRELDALSCADQSGKMACSEPDRCKASAQLSTLPNGGVEILNTNLRAAGSCDKLDNAPGADDVFDLTDRVRCSDPISAPPPPPPQVVNCEAVFKKNAVPICTDLLAVGSGCSEGHEEVKKGDRWADEEFLDANLDSDEACLQKVNVATQDGCCGG
jgi:hypothetical protein